MFFEQGERLAAPLYRTLSDILIAMDILVYSPEEVEEWSIVPQAFVTTAIREGRAVYENQGWPSKSLDSKGGE